MLFNSFEFLVFLPLVFLGYWALGRHLRLQNLLVLVASYVFYGWWDWRFLSLIAFTSAWSYVVGLVELRRWDSKPSKTLLTVSLIVNLGILGVFKYYGFFMDSLTALLPFDLDPLTLDLVLPVGISFYTFQALSYTIDVYRRQIRPTRDPVAFFAFISFFPQLVAGPIERATNLLPQFLAPRRFDYALAVDGGRQMLWGFFKKMVVADSLSEIVKLCLCGDLQSNGAAIAIGAVFFSVLIYADFSGYSDIAIGCGKLFGVRFRTNFRFPYFARDIAEFWRRWHISLTTWFRDYVYIPLGGSRGTKAQLVRNTFAIFLLSGLWHGANWTFVLWGALHALLFLPLLLGGRNRAHRGEFGFAPLTLLAIILGWLLFYAPSIATFGTWCRTMATPSSWGSLGHLPHEFGIGLGAAAAMFVFEWFNRREEYGFARYPSVRALRWVIYLAFVGALVFGAPASHDFVYFKF